jgi:hypothetical protein
MTVVKLPVGDDRCPGAMAEFEVDPDDLDGIGRVGRAHGAGSAGEQLLSPPLDPGRAGDSLAAALDRTLPALSLILAKLRAATSEVDDITVDLGLRIGGETGLVFARGSADATIAVSLTWHRSHGDSAH